MRIVKHIRLLLASEGLRSSILMMGGNVFAQGLSGIAIIILSRVIGPEQFGIFSTGFSLALIAASIVDLGLTAAQQQAIPRAESPEKRNAIFGTVIALKVVLSLLIIVCALPLAPILGSYLHFSSASLLFWLVLANVGSIFFNQLASMLLSVKRVGQTVLINTIQASTKLILSLLVLFLGWRSGTGILLSYIALPLVLLPFSRMLLPKWYLFSATFNAKSWLEMRSMALNNWVASFGLVLIQNVDIVLVSLLLTVGEAGLMAAASRLALFISVFASSLAAVLIPRVSTYREQHDLDLYWRKALLIFFGSTLMAVASFFISGVLIQYTVGQEYLAAAPVLGFLLAASWLGVGITPINSLFFSYDKPWFFSSSALLQAGLLISGNWYFLSGYGIAAAGWIRLATQLLLVLFSFAIALYSHHQRFHTLPRFR